jgi:hypothetical protein
MQTSTSMEDKLALWKANKKSKVGNKSSLTQPLRVKTNAGQVKPLYNPNAGQVKPLDNPKTVLKKPEENITRILPDNVIQSALSIVSRIETPNNPLRIKPLPSPHLLTMEKVTMSADTQTMPTYLEYNELMILYQEQVQQVKELRVESDNLRHQLSELEKEKNFEILKVVESNEELQDKLTSLKTFYDQGSKQLLEVQESFLQELSEKGQLKNQVEELLFEKSENEAELKEFQDLISEMTSVLTESDKKDQDLHKCQIKLEEKEEEILALQVQIFKKDKDFSEFQDDFLTLKASYDECCLKIDSFQKQVCICIKL